MSTEHTSRHPKLTTSDYAIGICLLLVVVVLWTVSNFVTQYMFSTGGYQKPFMLTYLSTASFTVYLLPSCLRKSYEAISSRRRGNNYQLLTRDPNGNHEPSVREATDRLTPEETAKLSLCFCFLWFAANWTLNIALAYTSVASATVLSSMSCIFTLAIGRVFRVEALSTIKIGAVLASIGGVVLVSVSDSSSSSIPTSVTDDQAPNLVATLGDVLALFSALFYAIYLIFLKVQIKEESRIDMQLFFGYVGLFNILLCWPGALVLHWFGVETLGLPDTQDAVYAILANMLITLSSDYLYVVAMLKTTPLVATIGLSLTIPLAVVGDYFLGKPATFQVLVGAVLVAGAFIAVGIENSKARGGESVPAGQLARTSAHLPSAKLSKRQFAVQENAVEAIEIGAADGAEPQDILDSLNAVPASANKREKQQLKHEAFIDRIKTSTAPYSKAQKRRFNRRQREQLGGGLASIETAISTLEAKEIIPSATAQRRPQTKGGIGRIGKGKDTPLTMAQRKRVLSTEKFRHPRILASPEYAANPFQTIRTHAHNTLEKRAPPV